jgi:hypothetical protein
MSYNGLLATDAPSSTTSLLLLCFDLAAADGRISLSHLSRLEVLRSGAVAHVAFLLALILNLRFNSFIPVKGSIEPHASELHGLGFVARNIPNPVDPPTHSLIPCRAIPSINNKDIFQVRRFVGPIRSHPSQYTLTFSSWLKRYTLPKLYIDRKTIAYLHLHPTPAGRCKKKQTLIILQPSQHPSHSFSR